MLGLDAANINQAVSGTYVQHFRQRWIAARVWVQQLERWRFSCLVLEQVHTHRKHPVAGRAKPDKILHSLTFVIVVATKIKQKTNAITINAPSQSTNQPPARPARRYGAIAPHGVETYDGSHVDFAAQVKVQPGVLNVTCAVGLRHAGLPHAVHSIGRRPMSNETSRRSEGRVAETPREKLHTSMTASAHIRTRCTRAHTVNTKHMR